MKSQKNTPGPPVWEELEDYGDDSQCEEDYDGGESEQSTEAQNAENFYVGDSQTIENRNGWLSASDDEEESPRLYRP